MISFCSFDVVWDGYESFGKCFVEVAVGCLSWIDLVTDIIFVWQRLSGPSDEKVYGMWSLLFVFTSWWALGFKTNMVISQEQADGWVSLIFC